MTGESLNVGAKLGTGEGTGAGAKAGESCMAGEWIVEGDRNPPSPGETGAAQAADAKPKTKRGDAGTRIVRKP
jgi:hypothetical protein